MRNESAKPGRGEVDLTQGWSLTAGPELAAEAGRFRAYLRQAMRAELKAGATGKQIRLAIDPASRILPDSRGAERNRGYGTRPHRSPAGTQPPAGPDGNSRRAVPASTNR